MARSRLRTDINIARAHARLSPGSGRELARLQDLLGTDEMVEAIAQARYHGCFGLVVLTNIRLLFLCDGIIWKVSDTIPLDRIGIVLWQSVFGFGTLTVHVAGAPLQFTGITGRGGSAVLKGLRAHLAKKDDLELRTRESILALAAHIIPEPAPDDISVLDEAAPSGDVPVAGAEYAAQM